MEKKNTVLLTVIAVATLLVAVVGATFAYFTASTSQTGTGTGTTNATTSTVQNVKLELTQANTKTLLDYPGAFGYTGISVDATKTETDTHEYRLTFDLGLSFTNATSTDLSWTLYKSTSDVTDNTNCTLTNDTENAGETRYYYTCTGSNTYGTVVDSGTVKANTQEASTKTVAQSLDTNADPVYYYLVLTYENKASSQNADQGKTINASITGVSNVKSVQLS